MHGASLLVREAVSTRGIFLVLWILASLTLSAMAQPAMPSAPPAAPTPAGPADAFERGTPRSAILGFLQACRDGDYERAAAYLDLSRLNSRDRAGAGPTLARRLKVVLDHTLWLDVEALSDDPNGHRDDRLPPKVHRETARARFVGFGGPSLHLEISAYILTAKLDEFLAIREDIFLQIMDIIEHSGGTIAAP